MKVFISNRTDLHACTMLYITNNTCFWNHYFIMTLSIGPEDFTIEPINVSFAPGVESVTVSITLTQDMISELDERFLLRLMERTSVGGALVEDLVVEPDEATVIIRDPGGGLHVKLSACLYLCLCEHIRASCIHD